MKVLINRKPVGGPWGGGNLFVKAFSEKLPLGGHKVVYEFSDDIDVIFVQDPRYSDLGISISGIAGPTGGTEEKPVGLVYIGLSSVKDLIVKKFNFFRDRDSNKQISSQVALNMLRLYLRDE